jgi:aryl carrier-like protein
MRRESTGKSLVLKGTLIAFISIPEANTMTELDSTVLFNELTDGLDTRLATMLPSYMIPAAFIRLDSLPIGTTGKTDRLRLRQLGSKLTLGRKRSLIRDPCARTEKLLREQWASVLGIEANDISIDDSFLQIGGDSVGAMKLVAQARQSVGLLLSVADVLQNTRLRDMALFASSQPNEHNSPEAKDISAFSMLLPDLDEKHVREQAAQACSVGAEDITDVFPCTPLQEGLLVMTVLRQDSYVARTVYDLSPNIDETRFITAWPKVLEWMPILRTRLIELAQQGLVQVVLRPGLSGLSREDSQENGVEMGMGIELCHARQNIRRKRQ